MRTADRSIPDLYYFRKMVSSMISVVMTSYNGEKYIEEQIRSILGQTRLPDELIIIDDCSKDSTFDIALRACSKAPDTVKTTVLQNEHNLGYIRNFYKAISLASGDFIFLSDQDDIWEENKIETMIKGMEKHQCDVLCSNYDLIDGNGVALPDRSSYNIPLFIEKFDGDFREIRFQRLIFGNILQGCTYCFTKRVQEKYVLLNCDYIIHDKQIMFIGTLLGKVGYLNKKLIRYRIHGNNSVGISKKQKTDIKMKKSIKRTPIMVAFLNDLNEIIRVPNLNYYNLLFYFRIPYIAHLVIKKIY